MRQHSGPLRKFHQPFSSYDDEIQQALVRGLKDLFAGGEFEGHHGEGFFNCAIALEAWLRKMVFEEYGTLTGNKGFYRAHLKGPHLNLGSIGTILDKDSDSDLQAFLEWVDTEFPNLRTELRTKISKGGEVIRYRNAYGHLTRKQIDIETARRLSMDCLHILSLLA